MSMDMAGGARAVDIDHHWRGESCLAGRWKLDLEPKPLLVHALHGELRTNRSSPEAASLCPRALAGDAMRPKVEESLRKIGDGVSRLYDQRTGGARVWQDFLGAELHGRVPVVYFLQRWCEQHLSS